MPSKIRRGVGYRHPYTHEHYGYQWGERPQVYGHHRGPWYPEYSSANCYAQRLRITVPSSPIQTRRLQSVEHSSEPGGEVSTTSIGSSEAVAASMPYRQGRFLVERGEGDEKFFQVVDRFDDVKVQRLAGISLLRVCKQLNAECARVLYGENLFSFIAESEGDDFRHFPQWIPGLPSRNGTAQTQEQLDYAIDRMFAPDGFIPKFVGRDSLLKFFSRIGRINTSLLKRVMVSGRFKTATETSLVPFERILNVHLTTLSITCPQLKELTLHRKQSEVYLGPGHWEGDEGGLGSDDEHLYEIVRDVIARLPSLRLLQLGGPELFNQENFVEDWGTAVKWMVDVAERTNTDNMKSKMATEQAKEDLRDVLANIHELAEKDRENAWRFAPRKSKGDLEAEAKAQEECTCVACREHISSRGRGHRRGRGR